MELEIAVGLSAQSKQWKPMKLSWADFKSRIKNVVRTGETYDEFLKASKDDQRTIKDVGGYIGGKLTGVKRGTKFVDYKTLITLDADYAPYDFWEIFTASFNNLALLHSTHKHSKQTPRYRLILPLSRGVNSKEYEAIARKVASNIGIDLFDNTTFQPERLMFWPSASEDAEFIYFEQEGPVINADEILDSYIDWTNADEWAYAEVVKSYARNNIDKQEDPLEKTGVIGLFCRTYTIQEAIAEFLSEVYIEVNDDRYTYIKGTTSGGLIVHDNKFAYSYHSTDPASGRLCNVFDLVRIHRFGHLDAGKTGNNLPSVKAMENFIIKDDKVKITLANEKVESAAVDFKEAYEDVDLTWMSKLAINSRSEYDSSASNLNIIFENDLYLKGTLALNIFDNKRYLTRNVPWRDISEEPTMRDVDYSGIRNYIESIYGIVAPAKIEDVISLTYQKQAFHPIREYIKGLTWDGTKRVETLLIDFLGAEDKVLTRAVIKKILVGAISRVFIPGIKFDLVLTLVGEQRAGKSTFISKLGKTWFSDTFTTVQGKEAYEQIQGKWIIEIAELAGLKKAEIETIKHYISKCDDTFRPAYARTVETYKRQCIFIGSTNEYNFLRDPTGNRRFVPVKVDRAKASKSVWDDLTEDYIDQVWAEAYVLYNNNETIFFSEEEEATAKIEQTKYSEVDERRGIIEDFLNTDLPKDWDKKDTASRCIWFEADTAMREKGISQRNYVCVAEIWCECLGNDKTQMSRYNTRDINDILKSLQDWEYVNSTRNFPNYGKQKYYQRRIE